MNFMSDTHNIQYLEQKNYHTEIYKRMEHVLSLLSTSWRLPIYTAFNSYAFSKIDCHIIFTVTCYGTLLVTEIVTWIILLKNIIL